MKINRRVLADLIEEMTFQGMLGWHDSPSQADAREYAIGQIARHVSAAVNGDGQVVDDALYRKQLLRAAALAVAAIQALDAQSDDPYPAPILPLERRSKLPV